MVASILIPGRCGPLIIGATAGSGGWTGPTSGLTHRWPMDAANVSGSTITDVVAGLNGTASGAGITATTGPSGASNAARGFDGSSSISLASNPFSAFNVAHSIFCWIKDSDITSGSGVRALTFDTNSGVVSTIVIDNGSTYPAGTPSIEINGTYGSLITSGQPVLTNNAWYHLGYTSNGSATTIYLNGAAATQTVSIAGFSLTDATYIFGGRDASNRLLPNGSAMAQIVTYSSALSSGEVTTLYNAF